MPSRARHRMMFMVLALAMVATACGDTAADTTTTAAPATTTTAAPATTTTTTAGDTTTSAAPGVSLAGVCPDPIVIQTDWFPEAEHGAIYELVGDDYTIDKDNKIVSGSLMAAGGVDTGIAIEVRTGGPAIGFQPVSTQMYTDTDVTIGYVSTDEAAAFFEDAPTIAVVSPLEKNPQIIMWDPDTYPDIKTIADLGEAGVTINVFAGGTFIEVFVAQGVVAREQVDPSYDGSPARFVAQGDIAQQGFASAEPYNYEFVFSDYGKPVAYELIHDAGFEVYSQALAIRADDFDALSPCLELFVPIVQQATVDYINNPDRANAIIIDAVATFEDFWVYDQALADYSVTTQLELGLVGNGADDTIGNMDDARTQAVIDQMVSAGMSVLADLTAADISTNDFIDPSIGL